MKEEGDGMIEEGEILGEKEKEGDRRKSKQSLNCANVDKKETAEEKNVSSTGFLKGSKFYVSCKISPQRREGDMMDDDGLSEEVRAEFFVDTGAECSIISSSLVEHMRKRTDANLELKGFIGQYGMDYLNL